MSEIPQSLQVNSQPPCKSTKPESLSMEGPVPAPFIKLIFQQKFAQYAEWIWNANATIQNQYSLEEFTKKVFAKVEEQGTLDKKVFEVQQKTTLIQKDFVQFVQAKSELEQFFDSEAGKRYMLVQKELLNGFLLYMNPIEEKVLNSL